MAQRRRARRSSPPTWRCSTGALHAFRLATADPYLNPVERHQALVARIGYGRGDEVADGLWTDARELIVLDRRLRRSKILHPQARLAALLGGRERPLACEELALRARLDLEHERRVKRRSS